MLAAAQRKSIPTAAVLRGHFVVIVAATGLAEQTAGSDFAARLDLAHVQLRDPCPACRCTSVGRRPAAAGGLGLRWGWKPGSTARAVGVRISNPRV
ncbi:MAG: hypothetical protein AB1716_00685 [Planctomycetota bacterium]